VVVKFTQRCSELSVEIGQGFMVVINFLSQLRRTRTSKYTLMNRLEDLTRPLGNFSQALMLIEGNFDHSKVLCIRNTLP